MTGSRESSSNKVTPILAAPVSIQGTAVSGRVSFIVPTQNSAETIEECLRSLRVQSHGDIEVIIVDNQSTDETVRKAGMLADTILRAGPERSAQRNAGARVASGEFLVFVDSDMILERAVAAEILKEFRREPVLDALVLPERSQGQGFWARCKSLEKELYLGDPSVEAARAFRRTCFFRTGGYDETIHGGGEDWDLPERILGEGGRIGRIASFVLHEEGRLRLLEDLQKKLYYGRTFGRYLRKSPRCAAAKLARFAFLRKVGRLVEDPLAAAGLLLMKVLELGAVLLGMALALSVRHPVESRRGWSDGRG